MTPTARLLSIATIFLLAAPLASATHESFPGKPGKLVFQSNRNGNYELYLANANGSGVRKLLSRPQTDEFNANWSPSGTKIVFQTGPRDRSTYDIWLVNADGKGAKPLVSGATNDLAPQFCDERTVVFTRQVTSSNSEVYAIGANGEGLRQLTNNPGSDSFPTCNPKGTRVAFITNRDGGPRIYEMTRTGTGLRALTDGAVDPDYSSDGKALAYVAPDADRNLEVFTKNLATEAVTQRTNVKPPFEYRLPKFVPEAAKTRLASGRTDEKDGIVATKRNTQTAAEDVDRVGDETSEVPNGSGGSVQPIGPCECAKVDLQVLRDARRTSVVRFGTQRQDVKLRIRWALRCTAGAGGCSASATLTHDTGWDFDAAFTSPKEFDENKVAISCKGPCGKTAVGSRQLKLNGSLENDFTLQLTVFVKCRSGSSGYFQDFKLFFKQNGRLDREDSDLNGNGRPDGKEK